MSPPVECQPQNAGASVICILEQLFDDPESFGVIMNELPKTASQPFDLTEGKATA